MTIMNKHKGPWTIPFTASPPSGNLLPWGTWLLDSTRLFYPRTWLGVLRLMDRSYMSTFRLDILVQGVQTIFVPIICLWSIRLAGFIDLSNELLLAWVVSPWTMTSLFRVLPELFTIAITCIMWIVLRRPPDVEAMETLRTRVYRGRAYRTRRYDVYLPKEYRGRALLFFPGAMISHAAYSQVAAQLSDLGLVVVVVSFEPLRLADHELGASTSEMLHIMRQVEHDYCVKVSSLPTRWCLGGHSMGTVSAMELARTLHPSHLVLWAIGAYRRFKLTIGNEPCPTLIVQASCDNTCRYTPKALRDFLNELPSYAVYKAIEGGNHSGFGTYTGNPTYDGIRTISREEQHRLVTTMTAEFLFQ